MKQLDVDWNLLDRYFGGEASPDEVATVSRWSMHAENAAELRALREIWDAAGVVSAPPSVDLDVAWRSITDRMHHDGTTPVRPTHTVSNSSGMRRTSFVWPVLLAASVVVVAGVALTRAIETRESPKIASQPSAAAREFATRRAQRADIYLSDGTHVLLNVDSKLRVAADYGDHTREVTLDGEAYFDVIHDELHPFRVRTVTGIAEDVGTKFVVARYPEAKAMHVGVAEGTVIVRRDSVAAPAATLKRGDLLRIGEDGRTNLRHGVDIDRELAWTTGELIFDRVPLADVLPQLSRWFDADIRLGSKSLSDVPFTASFRNQPIAQVLELFAASLDAHVERDVNGYVLYAGKGSH